LHAHSCFFASQDLSTDLARPPNHTSPSHSCRLNLGKNTSASLQAFRKRSEDARRALAVLKEQKTDVDFQHYRSVLKNDEVVSQAEKILKDFKPVTYDVSAQIKAIDAFGSKAVS
jgi:F-type H+-transporting ATPase subunit d